MSPLSSHWFARLRFPYFRFAVLRGDDFRSPSHSGWLAPTISVSRYVFSRATATTCAQLLPSVRKSFSCVLVLNRFNGPVTRVRRLALAPSHLNSPSPLFRHLYASQVAATMTRDVSVRGGAAASSTRREAGSVGKKRESLYWLSMRAKAGSRRPSLPPPGHGNIGRLPIPLRSR